MRAMPLTHYSTGTYEFWFGATKKFDRNKEVGYRVTIFRRPPPLRRASRRSLHAALGVPAHAAF